MKRSIVKVIAIMCCVVLISSFVFSGCGSKSQGNNKTIGNNSETKANSEPTKISIIHSDITRISKDDDPVKQEIEKKTNTKIQLTFVPGAEFTNKYNLLVASNDMPDISRLAGYSFFQYIPQGAFLELSSLVDKYATNIKKIVPKEAWDRVKLKDKLYAIPCYNWPGKFNLYIRQDWLDNLGLKQPTNLIELEDVLKKFTYNDPDKNGKNDTYGLSAEGEIMDLPSAFMAIFGAFGVQPYMYYEKDGKVYSPFISPEYKDAIEYISKLYKDDKVINPDIFILKTDQMRQDLAQGKEGVFSGWWSIPEQYLADQLKMKQINPNAKWSVIQIKGKDGQTGMISNGMVNATSNISAKSKNSEVAIKLLDYLASDEGAILSQTGIKDRHYTTKSDGTFEKRTAEGNTAMDGKWLDSLSQMVFRVDINMNIYKINNPTYWPYIEAARDTKLYSNLFEGITTTEAQKYLGDLKKLQLEWFVKFVTGKEPISKFDEYAKQWKEKGGKAVMDSYIKEYNSMKGKNFIAGN